LWGVVERRDNDISFVVCVERDEYEDEKVGRQ